MQTVKKWYIKVIIIIIFNICNTHIFAQSHSVYSLVTEKLIEHGFENVSTVICDSCVAITLEINHFKTRRDGVKLALDIITGYSEIDRNTNIVLLRNGIPYISISAFEPTKSTYRLPNGFKISSLTNRSLYKTNFVFVPLLGIRNQKYHKVYDVVFNIAPSIEFSPWRGGLLSAEVIIPIVNQYGKAYADIRPGIITLAQRFRVENIFGNITIGNFNKDRWGANIHLYRPFTAPYLNRFALSVAVGYTGSSQFYNNKWYIEQLDKFTGHIGVHYFNRKYNTEVSLKGIQFIGQDKGIRLDIVRHFKHVSLGLFAMKNDYGDLDGGFNFAVLLPPYKTKKHRRFNINTTHYFDFELEAAGLFYRGKEYRTSRRMFPAEEQWNPWSLTNFGL